MRNRIKILKQELAEIMFKAYTSLDDYDKKYVDLMMDDDDIKDNDFLIGIEEFNSKEE